jgi:hypothetical protein
MSHTTITAGLVAPAVVTLVDGATVAVNASLGNDFRLRATRSGTIANPTGAVDGQRITFQITRGGSGLTLNWGSQYKFGSAGAPTLSSATGQTDVIGFIYNASLGSWLCAGAALGF